MYTKTHQDPPGELVVAVTINHMQVIAVTRSGAVFGWGLTCEVSAQLQDRGRGWRKLAVTSSPSNYSSPAHSEERKTDCNQLNAEGGEK